MTPTLGDLGYAAVALWVSAALLRFHALSLLLTRGMATRLSHHGGPLLFLFVLAGCVKAGARRPATRARPSAPGSPPASAGSSPVSCSSC